MTLIRPDWPSSQSLLRLLLNFGLWAHIKVKEKVNRVPQESVWCLSPSTLWARSWRITNVCDAWPGQRQTYGYLPSRKASPPTSWYQIILLGDRGTCVLTTFPGLNQTAGRLEFEPATASPAPCRYATEPLSIPNGSKKSLAPCGACQHDRRRDRPRDNYSGNAINVPHSEYSKVLDWRTHASSG